MALMANKDAEVDLKGVGRMQALHAAGTHYPVQLKSS